MTEQRAYYRRNLPHWYPPGATIFITFRLVDSLPETALLDFELQRQQMLEQAKREPDAQARALAVSLVHRRAFALLDRSLAETDCGARWLSQPHIGDCVSDCLRDAGGFYRLEAFCIMPNHVHVVMTPLASLDGSFQDMVKIMQRIKGRSAYRANQLLGRSGRFWLPESYDHVVRDDGELERVIKYVLNNPVKAGLVRDWREWRWNYAALAPVELA